MFSFIAFAISRLWFSAIHNHRNVLFLVVNFCINFSPIFVWLSIFKNAGLIPIEWRPPINVKLVYYMDVYYYKLDFIGIICAIFTMACGLLLYLGVFRVQYPVKFASSEAGSFIPLSTFQNDDDCSEDGATIKNEASLEDNSDFTSSSSSNPSSATELTPPNSAPYSSAIRFIKHLPPGYSPVLITLFFGLSWPILNVDYYFGQPQFICKGLDILAWTLYVLCHITVPIVTAVYLYVFQPPGAVKYFSCALGVQNIAGVLTHLLFPNAPPWFIHLNGLDVIPDYNMPGFAAGLTRVDVALGTHLNSKGFHKSPIVFGAFPSLHSAMAVQVFLHINYYSNWWSIKCLSACFVFIQWWATIYLDHHFRADLFFGMIYAYLSFVLFQKLAMTKLYTRFYESYFFDKDRSYSSIGTTMGMRVFANSRIAWFFDPYQ